MHLSATDVLIVGAGPVGLTLATDLARRGVDVRIVDRDTTASRASKAKTVQPRALEVLDDLGAVDDVLRVGVTDLPMRFHDGAGAVTDKPGMSVRANEAFATSYPDPIWIAQFDVDAALRSRLRELGVTVELGSEARLVGQDDDAVTVQLSTAEGLDEEVRARYVVAADGGRSGIRKQVGLSLVAETYENQCWYLGDVTTTIVDRERMHIWTSERGMIGLTPLPGSDLWQLQSPIRPDEEPEEPSLVFFQAMFDERAGAGAVTLTSATWLSVYRVNVRMVEQYRQGRVLLAGDAAHVHSPAGGQGMNTGIQDAYNLGWKLAAILDGADDALLDTYGSERIPVARAVLEDSTRKMRRTTTSVTASTDQGLSAVLGSIADDITTGLPVGYPNSPLTLRTEQGGTATVFPGDRAQNATGLRGDGFDGTLFDLIRGPRWTLVAFNHDGPLALERAKSSHLQVLRVGQGAADEIVDGARDFQHQYGAQPGELFLIRPDGYLAARVPAADEPEILVHLAAFWPNGSQL